MKSKKAKVKRQKIVLIFFLLLFTFYLFSACSKQKAIKEGIIIADSDKYEATIFRQNCAICHGSEGLGKDLNGKPVPSLRFGEAAKKSRAEIYQQIKHGKLPMPAFENQLTETEINKMVDFIMYDLQGREKEVKK